MWISIPMWNVWICHSSKPKLLEIIFFFFLVFKGIITCHSSSIFLGRKLDSIKRYATLTGCNSLIFAVMIYLNIKRLITNEKCSIIWHQFFFLLLLCEKCGHCQSDAAIVNVMWYGWGSTHRLYRFKAGLAWEWELYTVAVIDSISTQQYSAVSTVDCALNSVRCTMQHNLFAF